MPWCPNCKDEYREGITVCADCGATLVDDLSLCENEECNEEEEGYFFELPREDIKLTPEELSTLPKEKLEELALKAQAFRMQYDEETNKPQKPVKASVYVNNDERAEENKASAYALLVIGGLGIVAIILFFLDVIPISMNKFGKYTITGVMGVLFVLFFIMGIVSIRNFKAFKQKAVKENNLTVEIKKWCMENLIKEEIDSLCDFNDVPEELKYFGRTQLVKDRINNQFMNLDDSYLNRLIEDIYPEIFEKEW